MKYKMICTDIDGTLLNSESRILPSVKESLRDAAKKGILIALASGRMPSGVNVIEKELGTSCIKICNAGSYIIYRGECIGAEWLPNHVIQEIYQKVTQKYGIGFWIFREEEWFVTGVDEYVKREIPLVSYQPTLVDAQELAKKWKEEGKAPNKLLIAANPKLIQRIGHELREEKSADMDMACSSNEFIEIFPKGTNKGKALRTVCKKVGVDLKEVIAFGDHELDIPMIEMAGTGVAMGNAITGLKEKSDFVTKTNDEAGIACALDVLLKEE